MFSIMIFPTTVGSFGCTSVQGQTSLPRWLGKMNDVMQQKLQFSTQLFLRKKPYLFRIHVVVMQFVQYV